MASSPLPEQEGHPAEIALARPPATARNVPGCRTTLSLLTRRCQEERRHRAGWPEGSSRRARVILPVPQYSVRFGGDVEAARLRPYICFWHEADMSWAGKDACF
jgi:hypothetical protein